MFLDTACRGDDDVGDGVVEVDVDDRATYRESAAAAVAAVGLAVSVEAEAAAAAAAGLQMGAHHSFR